MLRVYSGRETGPFPANCYNGRPRVSENRALRAYQENHATREDAGPAVFEAYQGLPRLAPVR